MRDRSASRCPSASAPTVSVDRHRVALDVMLRGLLAREHRLHRPLQQVRGDRRLRLDRQLLLRAERAAAGGQRDLDVLRDRAFRTLAICCWSYTEPWLSVWTLTPFPCGIARHASGSRNAISIGCVWNVASMTCAALCQRGVHVSARERGDRLQHVRRPRRERVRRVHQRRARLQRLERIGERLEHLVVDLDLRGRLARVKLRVGDDHREEVGDAAGELAFGDEDRLVGIVEAGAAEARARRPR